MPYRPDITVSSPDGQHRLLVEVKTRKGQDEEWARQFRRNILAHFPTGDDAYFLLVLPETIYLWLPESRLESGPDFTASTRDALGQFYEKSNADELGERALELVVTSWLSHLFSATPSNVENDGSRQEWLLDSGLYEAVRGGHLEREVAI